MFDDELILKDGSVALDENDTSAVTLAINADGNYVRDIKKTGKSGLYAVLICPTSPTTYSDTLDVYIQASHHITDGWETVAQFPRLYTYMREVKCTPTTLFVSTDIGLILTATTDSASDGGVIIDFDHKMISEYTLQKILVKMSDADDDYSTAADTLTATSGTGVGTQGVASVRTAERSYGIFAVRFQTDRRYVRGLFTVSSGGAWGLAECYITNSPPNVVRL